MKHRLFAFAFGLLAISAPALGHAQQMMIGARAGLNLANEYYTSLPSDQTISDRLLGFGGLEFDYWFNNSVALSLQPLYLQKGAHGEAYEGAFGPPGQSDHADWTISYLEVPLLAKFSLGSKTVRPYFFAGPSIGFLLKNTEIVSSMSDFTFGVPAFHPNYIDTTADISDSTAKIEFSIIGGLGCSFLFSSGARFFFDLSYSFGLTNIDNYSWDKAYGISVYSRDIRLAAGVLFPIR